jgi:hypothetical protein
VISIVVEEESGIMEVSPPEFPNPIAKFSESNIFDWGCEREALVCYDGDV